MNAIRPQPSPSRSLRQGFTLVELLVVILIIGLLVALVSTAAVKALTSARSKKMKFEIDEISRAVVDYANNNNGEYPPSFASFDTSGNNAERNRITRHIQRRFPRYTPASTASTTATAFYDNFRADVLALSPQFGYNTGDLDINNIDQAEALVFWLAGFPTNRNSGTAAVETRVCGFSKDPTRPFAGIDSANASITVNGVAIAIQAQRTNRFPFDPTRLVDRDGDYWLEYVPPGVSPAGDMTPYVYFDSLAYTSCTTTGSTLSLLPYPSNTGSNRGPTGNVATWGQCWPLMRVYGTAGSTPLAQWVNSETFQILGAGLDGQYTTGALSVSKYTYPTLIDATVTPLSPANTDSAMYDNVTNFAEGTLQEERERQK